MSKRKKPLRTRLYWAHESHVREGRMVLCDRKRTFPRTQIRVALVPVKLGEAKKRPSR